MRKRSVFVIIFICLVFLLISSCNEKNGDLTSDSLKSSSVINIENKTNNTIIIPSSNMERNPQSAVERKDSMIIGINSINGLFIPPLNSGVSIYDKYIFGTIFDSLICYDEEGNPKDSMATYEISSDGLKYTFKLKDGIKFSDGSIVTTEDIAFTYTIFFDSSYDGVSDYSDIHLVGSEEYRENKKDSVEGIKIIDENTIEFTLEEPYAPAINYFTASILSKSYYGKNYKQGSLESIKSLNEYPMGSGAYKLLSYSPGDEVMLTANENYWRGKPKIKNIVFKVVSIGSQMQAFQMGEIDLISPIGNEENVELIKKYGFGDIFIFPSNSYGYITMNENTSIFKDKRVRQALAYGLNRSEIVNAIFGSYANVINSPNLSLKINLGYLNDYLFNMETAKKLLDEAGWKVSKNGIREKDGEKLKIRFLASNPNSVNDVLIPIAKENYKELGIDFEVEQLDSNTVQKRMSSRDYEMAFSAWALTPEPSSNENVFGTGKPQNNSGYSNDKVDILFKESVKINDSNIRRGKYEEIYKIINEELPYIFLYQRMDMWVINGRIKGINPTQFTYFYEDLWKAEIKE